MFVNIKDYKLLIYGLFTYGLFSITLVNALSRSNNFLQLLLQLFSSNSNLLAEINGATPSYNISNLITLNFILYNSYVFVNIVLIKWLFFGELRLIEIQHINSRFVTTIINDIVMFMFFMNTQATSDSGMPRDINLLIQQAKSNFTLSITIYVIVSLSIKMIYWINTERLKMIYSKLTNDNFQHSRSDSNSDVNEEFLTGDSLEEDKAQLKVKNVYFVLNFYKSRYFLILLALTFISVQNAWKYNVSKREPIGSNNSLDILSWAFRLFFTVMSINSISTWCFSIVNLIDAYTSKCQQDTVVLKLRESMRQMNNESAEELSDSLKSDSEEDEDLDSDDEGIFGYNDTFEAKYRIELMISLVTNVLHVIARFIIAYTNSKLSGLSILFSNEMLSQIHSITMISKNLMTIYNKYEQLQDLPSPTEAECDKDDTCIICMDSLYPTKHQLNMASKKHKVFLSDGLIQEGLSKFKPKTLPCGHYLHLYCLKSWFERSKSCPMCRMDIFDAKTGKIRRQVFHKNPNRAEAVSTDGVDRESDDVGSTNSTTENNQSIADPIVEAPNDEIRLELNGSECQPPYEAENSVDSQDDKELDNDFAYEDTFDENEGVNYRMFYFGKDKVPSYDKEEDELTLATYEFAMNGNNARLRHVLQPSEHRESPKGDSFDVEIDTTGFIPI